MCRFLSRNPGFLATIFGLCVPSPQFVACRPGKFAERFLLQCRRGVGGVETDFQFVDNLCDRVRVGTERLDGDLLVLDRLLMRNLVPLMRGLGVMR